MADFIVGRRQPLLEETRAHIARGYRCTRSCSRIALELAGVPAGVGLIAIASGSGVDPACHMAVVEAQQVLLLALVHNTVLVPGQ